MATVDLEVGERSDGHENDSQSDPTTTSGPHIAEQALPLPLQRNHSAHADTTFFQVRGDVTHDGFALLMTPLKDARL